MTEIALNSQTAAPGQRLLARSRLLFAQLSNFQRSLLLGSIIAVIYLATHSGCYVPSSDGAFYLCVARNLYDGSGFTFNGQGVANIPPGWPVLLAGAMHLSRSFFFLGLISVLCLSSAVAIWYLVICASTDSTKAFVAMLICGLLHTWYDSAQNYFSEAPFLLCLGGAVLVAQRIAAGASLLKTLPLLLALTAATVCFRWIGIASWAIIAAAVMGGSLEFRPNRKWVSAVLIMATTFASFQLCTLYVTSPSHVAAYIRHNEEINSALTAEMLAAGVDQAAESESSQIAASAPVPNIKQNELTPIPIAISETGASVLLPSRFLHAGEWLTSLLCSPAELARASSLVGGLSNLAGWVLWLSFLMWTIHRAKQGDWLWLGTLLYCMAVMMRWGHVVQRYMLPAAPMLVIGIWNGVDLICRKLPRIQGAFVSRGLMAAILIINCMLLFTDIYIARSDRFGEKYYAGYSLKLVQVSDLLRQRNVSDGEVAVSSHYLNLNLDRPNTYAERQLNLLLGRTTKRVPPAVSTDVPDRRLVKWAMKNNVHYYLFRTPVSPWRVWHFRMPSLQAWITGKPVKEEPDWVLYDLRNGRVKPVTLPVSVAWPTTVPETIFR